MGLMTPRMILIPQGFLFFTLVQPFVLAVKQAMGWEAVEEPPKKYKSFSSLSDRRNFPSFLLWRS